MKWMEWGVWPQRNIGLCLMETLTCPSMCHRRTSVFGAQFTRPRRNKAHWQRHHIKRRGRARDEKEKDKQEAKKDDSRHVITVDMQALWVSCIINVSSLYTTSQHTPCLMAKELAILGTKLRGKEVTAKLQLAYSCTALPFLLLFMTWPSTLNWAEPEPVFGDIVHAYCQHYPTRSGRNTSWQGIPR